MTPATIAPPETSSKPAQSAKLKVKHSWWQICAQTAIVTVMAVLSLEIAFGIAGIGEEEYLKPDPVTGADGIPNKAVTFRKEGFGRFRYNSFGMQDVERSINKPEGTLRIVCLGDSLTEALQVDRKQNFCSVLQNELTGSNHRNCEVMNFGVSNSSIGQMYLRLKHKVWKFHPDVVALCIRPDSVYQLSPNPQGGFIYARPSFFLDAKGDLIEDMTVQRLWEKSKEGKRMRTTGWLREHSHIWGVISKGVEQFSAWLQQAKKGTAQWGADVTDKQTAFKSEVVPATTAPGPSLNVAPAALTSKTIPAKAPAVPVPAAPVTTAPQKDRSYYDNATDYFWPTARRLLQEIASECDAHGAKLVIVRMPAYDGWRNSHETALLCQSAARFHATFVDTQPAFEDAAKTKQLFFDAHMRAAGHKIVADCMLKQLTR